MNISYHKIIIISIISVIFFLIHSSFTTNEWTLYYQSNGIQLYYQEADCDDVSNGLFQKFIIIKVINTTDFKVRINWEKELWYNNKCTTCSGENEGSTTEFTSLPKSETVGDCNNRDFSIFQSFKNHKDTPVLTRFELKNITIKPILDNENK